MPSENLSDRDLGKVVRRVNTIGYIYTGLGILQFLIVVIIFISRALLPFLSGARENDFFTTGTARFIVLFLLLFAIPSLPGGIGLLRHKRWARSPIIAVGFLKLLCVPLCTILGIYTIRTLRGRQVRQLFSLKTDIESNCKQ
jgi:hypothetical protein